MRPPKDAAERNSLDKAHEVLLAEVDYIRTEIIERLRFQKQQERLVVLVVGAILSTLSFIIAQDAEIILLLTALLLLGMATSFYSEDINIILAASYFEARVRPNIAAIVSEYPPLQNKLLSWEDYRHERFLRTTVATVMTINRNIVTFLPGCISLFAFGYVKLLSVNFDVSKLTWTSVEVTLLIINSIAFLLLLYLAQKVPRMYSEVSKQ